MDSPRKQSTFSSNQKKKKTHNLRNKHEFHRNELKDKVKIFIDKELSL